MNVVLATSPAEEDKHGVSPDLLGVSSTSFCFPSGIRLISRLKSARSEVVTVMGGYHPTMFDNLLLRDVTLAEGIRRAKRAHLLVVGCFVYGRPGETDQDFEATQKFIQAVRPHICGASALSIQPHAILWDKLIGDAEPLGLEDSHPRQMYTVPGQHSNEVIRRWRRGLGRLSSSRGGTGGAASTSSICSNSIVPPSRS